MAHRRQDRAKLRSGVWPLARKNVEIAYCEYCRFLLFMLPTIDNLSESSSDIDPNGGRCRLARPVVGVNVKGFIIKDLKFDLENVPCRLVSLYRDFAGSNELEIR